MLVEHQLIIIFREQNNKAAVVAGENRVVTGPVGVAAPAAGKFLAAVTAAGRHAQPGVLVQRACDREFRTAEIKIDVVCQVGTSLCVARHHGEPESSMTGLPLL